MYFMTLSPSSKSSRKTLKRPDSFVLAASHFLGGLLGHQKWLLGFLIGLLIVGATVSYGVHTREQRAQRGKDALYMAHQAFDAERALLSPPITSAKKKKSQQEQEALEFQKMDVRAVFPKTLEKLESIIREFSGTPVAFEAQLELGHLHFNHQDMERAISWFTQAIDQAPRKVEKSFALSALGNAYENLGKFPEALNTFQKALDLGEPLLRPELLLSLARCREASGELSIARTLYDQILVEFPNSDYSKMAELFQAQLPSTDPKKPTAKEDPAL